MFDKRFYEFMDKLYWKGFDIMKKDFICKFAEKYYYFIRDCRIAFSKFLRKYTPAKSISDYIYTILFMNNKK